MKRSVEQIMLRAFAAGLGTRYPYSTATKAGREANAEMMDYFVEKQWTLGPVNPTTPAPMVKHAWHGRSSPCHGRLVRVGSGLREPFTRVDLAGAANITPGKASNALTAWRECGWITGGQHDGWTRTSEFGKEGA